MLGVDAVDSHRLQWPDLPGHVRAAVVEAIGSEVVAAAGQQGGYGPGLAARCRLADGRRVFIKAVSAAQNPDSPKMMRHEASVAAALPPGAPAAALLHALDDGEWIALVFEDVDGALPSTPWQADQLARVVAAMGDLATLPTWRRLPSVGQRYGAMFHGWRTLAAEGTEAVGDPWCRDRLEQLAGLEAQWEHAAGGESLIHGDVRSDNILLTGDRGVVFVDWSSTCIGAPWFDLVAMLPSIELEGGGPPESVLRLARHADADDARLLPVVAAIAGYFAERGRLADPPGLPTLRDFQRAQGAVTIAWLRRLLARAG
jgi:aminoglycoside phosphotransferase (APT) family kinase protein